MDKPNYGTLFCYGTFLTEGSNVYYFTFEYY